MLNRYGGIENFPEAVLGVRREQALLFKRLATQKTDALLFTEVHQLQWRGPTLAFAQFAAKIGERAFSERGHAAAAKVIHSV